MLYVRDVHGDGGMYALAENWHEYLRRRDDADIAAEREQMREQGYTPPVWDWNEKPDKMAADMREYQRTFPPYPIKAVTVHAGTKCGIAGRSRQPRHVRAPRPLRTARSISSRGSPARPRPDDEPYEVAPAHVGGAA